MICCALFCVIPVICQFCGNEVGTLNDCTIARLHDFTTSRLHERATK